MTLLGGQAWAQVQYAELKFKVHYAQFDPATRSMIVVKNTTNLSGSQVRRNVNTEVNITAGPTDS